MAQLILMMHASILQLSHFLHLSLHSYFTFININKRLTRRVNSFLINLKSVNLVKLGLYGLLKHRLVIRLQFYEACSASFASAAVCCCWSYTRV